MATTTTVGELIINYLTDAQFDNAKASGSLNADEIYMTSPGNVCRIGNATITYNATAQRLEIEVL